MPSPDPFAPTTLEEVLYRAALDHTQQVRKAASAEYVTLDQAAVALNTTRWVVYGIVRKHNLPVRRVGKSITVRAADVAPYLP